MARILHIGNSGADVARLTTRLASLGYAVPRSSTFTDATHHAVMAFQKVNGLERDGVAGARTMAQLVQPLGVRIGRGAPDRVVIDRSDQVLMLVRGGRVRAIYNASTGNPSLPDGRGEVTPLGTFRVGRKVRGPHRAELGTLYWPSFFHGGIAVHGAPSVPATPQSHGCVRVPLTSARTIYDAMRAGTVVQVRA
ncbi:MAG: endopeptidase [Thermoleophilia bacterium]|nr:endopeptidase [Thermoleophilia bacterium]